MTSIDIEQLYTAARELTTDLLPRLQTLIPDPGTPLESSIGSHKKHTAAPIPWNDTAAMLYYEIHGDARHYETILNLRLFKKVKYRPGTDAHTTEAINRLPVLIAHALDAGLDQHADMLNDIARALTRWPRDIRHTLDEARPDELRWAKAPGDLRCPHCTRRLMVQPGWDKAATMPDLICRHCRDDTGTHLRYTPDTWIGVLQDNPAELTEAQAIEQLGIGSSTLRSWVHRGHITAAGKRDGRRTYNRDDLEALLQGSVA